MEFESSASFLKSQQDKLDRLFSITAETRHRLDEGNVTERELRGVYTRGIKEDPWAFMQWRKGFWWAGAGMALLSLVLSVVILLNVLGFGNRMFARQFPLAGIFTVLGVMGASCLIYLAVKDMPGQWKSLLSTRRAKLPASCPRLQVIDAEVSTHRYWDSNIGSEFCRGFLRSELVLHSVERACPNDAQAVREGRILIPGFLDSLIIVGRVRVYLIAGAYQSSPQLGHIVGITLFEGTTVTEKEHDVEALTKLASKATSGNNQPHEAR